MNPSSRHDLFPLLEALCDERLDAAGAARLTAAVESDPEARRLYLDYMMLHGLLHWDAVQGTGFTEDASTLSRPPLHQPTLHQPTSVARRRNWAIPLAAAAMVLVAATLVLLTRRQPPGDQVAGAARKAANSVPPALHDSKPPIVVDANESPVEPLRLPATDSHPDEALATDGPPVPAPDSVRPANLVAFIDESLERGWRDAEIEPSAPADDAEWVRRAYLDIAGRIPDVVTVDAFLADKSPRKRQALVNSLLDDPSFAGHMATVWTNLLVGRAPERDIDRDALGRFLREQFWKNRPWTETVTELVAAEGTEHENGAANFLLAHLNNQAVPATAITARIFLCEQVQCSQCHLHPLVKEWGQEKFWELNAFFSQTQLVEHTVKSTDGQPQTTRELVTRAEGGPTYFETLGGVVRVAYPKFNGEEVAADAGINRRRELARLMSEGEHPQLAAAFVNRMWAQFFGRGFTAPVDDMGPHNPPIHPEILTALTESFVDSGYDVRELVRSICSTRLYQLSSRPSDSNAGDVAQTGTLPLFSRMYLKPLTAEQLFDSLIASTNADRGGIGTWSEASERREKWLSQFYSALDNEENADATTFDGTLPQALVMMNGDLVREATTGRPGTFLHSVLTAGGSENDKLRQLCLSALSREPTPQEIAAFRQGVRRGERSQVDHKVAVNDALSDAYWAYLNSAEFLVNH